MFGIAKEALDKIPFKKLINQKTSIMTTSILNTQIEQKNLGFLLNIEISKRSRWSKLNIRQSN